MQDLTLSVRTYQALLAIPAPYRCEAAQSYLDCWRPQLGDAPTLPGRRSTFWMEPVLPPVQAEQLLSLTDTAVLDLLRWFEARRSEHWEFQIEGLVGGREELASQVREAAARDPSRFLGLLDRIAQIESDGELVGAVLYGSATHLHYRFGNLNPSQDWRPIEPLPDGPSLAEQILGFAERYGVLWTDERGAARVVEGCADVVESENSVARLVWLMLRLAHAKRPDSERVRFDPHKRVVVESRDLVIDAINEPRGIAAVSAMVLANRLAERGHAWPELLAPLLRRLASDPVASVRASILLHLPYLHHKSPDFGWELLERCLADPHPALWKLAGETLYYQLRSNFHQVLPYLQRMLAEAPGRADGTWSRLSTLAVLHGHIEEDSLFDILAMVDRPALWKGAAGVFSANIGNPSLAPACRSGLMRILNRAEKSEEVLISESDLTWKLGHQPADLPLVERFMGCINPERSQHLHQLSKWLASSARRDPRSTLQLLEKFAAELEEFKRHRIWMDDEAMVAAMLEILREADDSDETDLIHRAITLQDLFLALGLRSAEKMLERAVSF